MIRARIRNNRIPDHSLIIADLGLRRIGRPRRGYVHEDLFGVPGEERGEVGVERESDVGVFFFARGVVVRTTFDARGELVDGDGEVG
jgi:hypothetical protein